MADGCIALVLAQLVMEGPYPKPGTEAEQGLIHVGPRGIASDMKLSRRIILAM